MSSGSTSAASYSRQPSRLAQPSSHPNRLSFVAASAGLSRPSAGTAATTTTTTSTFQPHISKMQYNDTSQYQHNYQQNNALPNANTSGLPAPTSRLLQRSANESTGTAIPSTISSALRRRPAVLSASSISSSRPHSRLPSPSCMSSSSSGIYSPQHGESPLVRRSQSQRPAHMDTSGRHLLGLSSSARTGGNFRSQQQNSSSFTVHLRQASPVSQASSATNNNRHNSCRSSNSTDDDSDDDDDDADDDDGDDDAGTNNVEALPPLKSTSYISRLMTPNRESRIDATTRSAPPIRQTDSIRSSATRPSQLVKPLVTKNRSRQTSSNRQPGDLATDSQQLSTTDSSSISSSSSASATTKDHNKTPSTASQHLRAGSKLPAPKSADTRRLSLQHSGYGSLNLKLREPAHHAGSNSSRDEAAAPGSSRAQSESESPSDDEDSTTATTLTQMSESNSTTNSRDVGHDEFNNMIQMLSSKAILGSGADATRDRLEAGVRPADNVTTQRPTMLVGKDLAEANLSQPGFKTTTDSTKLVKSQSLSFNSHSNKNNNEQTRRQMPVRHADQSPYSNRSSGGGGHKLARPKSRIIFDPTSSQFHVSCSIEDEDDGTYNDEYSATINDDDGALSSSNSSNGDSSDENGLIGMEPIDSLALDGCDQGTNNDQDEVSRSLLNTRSQIMSLTQKANRSNQENRNSIRRLNECRGSLESLVRVAPPPRPLPDIPRPELAVHDFQSNSMDRTRRTKSPVGSALRSLFGIGSNQQQSSNGSLDSGPSASSVPTHAAKTGSSIVRHSSLRSDPRLYDNRFLDSKREYSTSSDTSAQELKQSSDTSSKPASHHLGSEFLLKAGKKLSASSSSLTSKFRFMSKPAAAAATTETNSGKASQSSDIIISAPTSNGIRRSLSITTQSITITNVSIIIFQSTRAECDARFSLKAVQNGTVLSIYFCTLVICSVI